MQSISSSIQGLHEELQWFCRNPEVKLVWVHCGGELRNTVMKLLPRYEFHHDNTCGWIVLEDAWLAKDEGWQVRANRLAQSWVARREAFAGEGVAMPEFLRGPAQSDGWSDFVHTATAACASVAEPITGHVLVLAPTVLEDPAAFEQQLRALISNPALARLRYVIVTGNDTREPPTLVRDLRDAGLHCVCEIDDAQQRKDLAAMLNPARRVGRAAAGAGAVPVGIDAPRRIDAPRTLPPKQQSELLRAAGLNPAYLDASPALGRGILASALAMKDGRGEEAVRLMVEARDRCATIGEPLFQVLCQITLASYLAGLGARARAVAELEDAVALADANALWVQQCQAHLALGLLHAQDRQHALAVQAYGNAGEAAERGGSGPLAIEAWRMGGQLLLQAGDPLQAVAYFQRALTVAEGIDPVERRESSAAEAARALAKLYATHGQNAQAESLYAQADAFEAGAETQQPAEAAPSASAD